MEDERLPVETMADLGTLDDAEILEGYRDGWDGFPCGANRSRSYWHGWQNGMRDKGRMTPSAESQQLAHAFIDSQRSSHTTRNRR